VPSISLGSFCQRGSRAEGGRAARRALDVDLKGRVSVEPRAAAARLAAELAHVALGLAQLVRVRVRVREARRRVDALAETAMHPL
jgi:hypothetical protein